MIKEAIIIAGGFGTRLKETIGPDIPKPMAPVDGRPFLEYVFHNLSKWGIDRLILATGYRHKAIEQYFGKAYKGQQIVYSRETEPLGTGGAVLQAMEHASGDVCYVINGDTYFDVNIRKMIDAYRAREADAVMALREADDVSRYGSVETSSDGRIIAFREKGNKKGPGFVNGGAYILNRKIFMELGLKGAFSLEEDFFEKHCLDRRIFSIRCKGFFLDIGIPGDYKQAQDAFEGIIID
jgi:D-glycero-alpha-D-manno-heptose 1-phosphate guanylyltransferase